MSSALLFTIHANFAKKIFSVLRNYALFILRNNWTHTIKLRANVPQECVCEPIHASGAEYTKETNK
jgi:hypothetical protein